MACVALVAFSTPAAADPVFFTIAAQVAIGLAKGLSYTAIFTQLAIQVALGAAASLLAKKPDIPSFDNLANAGRNLQSFRQAVTARRLLIGEARISGPIVYAESTGDNKYLHLVVVLGEGQFTSIDDVWLGDVPVYDEDILTLGQELSGRTAFETDVGGVVTQEFIANQELNSNRFVDARVKIFKHLGSSFQTADPVLIDETSLDQNFRLQGVAYLYIRLQFDTSVFPTSIPNISAWCRGPRVGDPRDNSFRWTPNPALHVAHYLRQPDYGLGVTNTEIDFPALNAAANLCDEIVPVSGSVFHDTGDVGSEEFFQNYRDLYFEFPTTGTGDDEVPVDVLEFQTGDRVRVSGPSGFSAGDLLSRERYVIVRRRRRTLERSVAISLADTLEDAYLGRRTMPAITRRTSGTLRVTKTGEPRYTANGIISLSDPPRDILGNLLSAMGGSAVYAGGVWDISASHYVPPTVTLDETHLRSGLSIRTRHGSRDRFNAVKGLYVSPLNQNQPTDYPPVTSTVYEAEDGGVRKFSDLDLAFTSRPHTAQRLAKRYLERNRRQITVTADFSLHAMQVQSGDTVALTVERMNWQAKSFEVSEWEFVEIGGPAAIGVRMTLREIDAGVDVWTTAEETEVPSARASQAPGVFGVLPPTNIRVSTFDLITGSEGQISYIVLNWDEHPDTYVLDGGSFEIQFRLSSATEWMPAGNVPGADTSFQIGPLEVGINYDIRIRARNHFNVTSAWVEADAFTLGAPSLNELNLEDDGLYSQPATIRIEDGGYGEVARDIFDDGLYS